MIQTYFTTLGTFTGLVLALPALLGAAVVLVSRRNKRASVVLGGFWAQIVFGGIGVIIHELSHLLAALLFGHKIKQFALLRIPNRRDPSDQSLGYVSHAWNPGSLYQRVGNVFIGVAPVLGCPLVMQVATRFLVPEIYYQLFGGVASGSNNGWLTALWLYLMVSIAIGGFDLSLADLENARAGLVALVVILLAFCAILMFFDSGSQLAENLFTLMRPVYVSFLFALAINLILALVLRIIRRVLNR